MSGKKVLRLGDRSDHGGYMVNASGKIKAKGIYVCTHGDQHVCPIKNHNTTSVSASTGRFKVNGRMVLRDGDVAGCGARLNASIDQFSVAD
jgi:uncharacterized Zn-binding protein involved in type VI secretion